MTRVNLTPQLDSAQQFGVSVVSAPGDQALYFNTANQLTVSLSNNTDSPIVLKAGLPVREGALPAGGPSAFYLMFGGALTSDQMSAIRLNMPGWHPAAFFDGPFPAVALVPSQDLSIPAQGVLAITLTNVVVSGVAGNATLTIDYYNVPGSGAPQWSLPKQNPPSGGKTLGLNTTLVSDDGRVPGIILISADPLNPLANPLKVWLKNDSPESVPIAGSVVIKAWFMYAKPPGYVALTTVDLSKQITLAATRVGQAAHDSWPAQITDDLNGRTWTLLPSDLKNPGPQLLEGHGGTLELSFTNIISALAPGPTTLYVQYSGIPGYDDGYYAIDFEKCPAATIRAFTVSPTHLDVTGAAVAAVFNWDVVNATEVQIVGVLDVTGRTSLSLPSAGARDYVMQVWNRDRTLARPDGHAAILTFEQFLCGRTFVLHDRDHSVMPDTDGPWTTDETLVERLVFASDGTGHYAYAIDGSTYGRRGPASPFHYEWSGALNWTRSGSQLSVVTGLGTITMSVAGDQLIVSSALSIGFPRHSTTFSPA